MWTSDDTVLTTTSITTVSVSMRNAQSTDTPPAWMKRSTGTVKGSLSLKATRKKAIHDSTAQTTRKPDVMYSQARAPICEPPRPAIRKPMSGRKTIAWYIRGLPSALHEIDVFDRDRAAVAIEDDEDGEPDRCFSGRDGEHEQRENLSDKIAQRRREGDEVDVDGQKDELDRHQDDDDVLAVEEDPEHAEREQDRRDREEMRDADGHQMPSPDLTFRISIAVA